MFYETTTAVLAVSVTLWVYFGPLERLRREQFRSDIRCLRDELFDFMWKNDLPFDEAAYVECRNSINSVLGVSNALSPVFFVLVAIKSPRQPGERLQSKNKALQSKINAVRDKVAERMICFVFGEGLTGWCLQFLVVGLKALRIVKSTSQVAARSIAGLESLGQCEPNRSPYCLPRA